MAKKMPKKMRARHMRTKQGGDRNDLLNGVRVKVSSKYNNENIEDAHFAMTPLMLKKWKEAQNARKK